WKIFRHEKKEVILRAFHNKMRKKFGMLIYEQAQPMDIIGPWEVMSMWCHILGGKLDLFMIAEKKGMVKCDNQITLEAEYDFTTSPRLDYLMVPGGRGRLDQVNNPALIDFIKNQAGSAEAILSVCTGMFLLEKAGILHHKSTTTYWRAFDELKKYSTIKIEEKRMVRSGNIWCSGGVTSGIDLSLAFIADTAGAEIAGKVQLLLEYFPETPPYAHLELIETLPIYRPGHQNVETLPTYIMDRIDK
ncbi:MAG: DJ-1/PfpI family protein, partial [Francisellaceae bacterium]